ncbi:hypothetical protein [Robbsia sp. KACC 23696]|uniref:hypothetical protein n=1 Tax=Robbsia sp. KACC 23696 TaxID=3149231 RepID=UPI00325A7FCC
MQQALLAKLAQNSVIEIVGNMTDWKVKRELRTPDSATVCQKKDGATVKTTRISFVPFMLRMAARNAQVSHSLTARSSARQCNIL